MTQIWFIAAAVLVLAELLVTTFFMLPFAIGAFFAGIASLITDSQDIQLGTFVVSVSYTHLTLPTSSRV